MRSSRSVPQVVVVARAFKTNELNSGTKHRNNSALRNLWNYSDRRCLFNRSRFINIYIYTVNSRGAIYIYINVCRRSVLYFFLLFLFPNIVFQVVASQLLHNL